MLYGGIENGILHPQPLLYLIITNQITATLPPGMVVTSLCICVCPFVCILKTLIGDGIVHHRNIAAGYVCVCVQPSLSKILYPAHARTHTDKHTNMHS